MVALQANAQLDAVYGEELAKILKATIQAVLFTATTALDLATAEMLEKVLGAYTTTAPNVSAGNSNSGVYGQTDTIFRIFSEHTQKNEMSAQYAIDFVTILKFEGSDLQKAKY